MEFEQLIVELFSIGCVKFGEFTLKSGIKSPVYFDLRVLISHPKLLKLACEVFADRINKMGIEYDLICGVPYGAIALATGISFNTNKPMIFKRKEAKCHGTKKSVEGNFKEGDRCLIVDDVMTSGISIMETVEGLRENGIQTDEAFVLLDREQGGAENLAKQNIKIHSVLKTTDVLNILLNNKKLNKDMYDKTLAFLNQNKNVTLGGGGGGESNTKKEVVTQQPAELSFETRGAMCENKIAKRLFEIMTQKQSNLCVAADYTSFDELLKLADQIGPHVCMIKTHVDMLTDFSMDRVQRLADLATKHNFLIFEDRKFADIGNTVKQQYGQGVYKIAQWAHIINAHSITGPGVLSGLKQVTNDFQNKGCLLIAQLSSQGNLIDEAYTKKTVEMAESNQDYVIGFICQQKLSSNPVLLHMTPGVQFNDDGDDEKKGDSLGQQYTSPARAILEHKCDIIIVGRGIIKSEDPVASAIRYKTAAYQSYLQRLAATSV